MLQRAVEERDLLRQRLSEEERISAQLASENESIGEYVVLYQQQRLVRSLLLSPACPRCSFGLLAAYPAHSRLRIRHANACP